MKNVKLFCLIALGLTLAAAPAWSQTAALQEPDACIVNPSAVALPKVHPTKKYVHLHSTPQTKARAHALAALHRHEAGLLPVAINICPPTKPAALTCRDTLGTSASLTAPQVEAMMVAAGYNSDPNSMTPAMVRAIQAHPDAAPALYAYALQHTNRNDQATIAAVSQAAYQAAPGKAAGLAYGGTLANPEKSVLVNQYLLASASPTDKTAIQNCAVIDLRTAAFVPSLAQPALAAVGQNDIRNNINNGVGVMTLVPGLEAREKDDSAT